MGNCNRGGSTLLGCRMQPMGFTTTVCFYAKDSDARYRAIEPGLGLYLTIQRIGCRMRKGSCALPSPLCPSARPS